MSVHDPELAARVEVLVGERVRSTAPARGGDIGVSACVELASGQRCFAKHYPGAPTAMAHAEARGLAWLRETDALRLPAVLGVANEGDALLVLEWIEEGTPLPNHDEALGQGLARLHLSGADAFGFAEDGFIGSLPQSNTQHGTWADFYRAERLAPLASRAAQHGLLAPELLRELDLLYRVLEDRCGPREEPARLHGDLWGGNRIVDASGSPVLIDPAVYGGHREVDLAMMRLFGGFGARVFDAYDEAAPLAPGARERVALYQLYPLLVHLNLFGGSDLTQFAQTLRRCL